MPNPLSLEIGDLVRFTSLPDEWSNPKFCLHRSSMAFMKKLIRRTWPSRVCRIDETGYPWIEARIRERGKLVHHSWMITESTGWRLVARRSSAIKRGRTT